MYIKSRLSAQKCALSSNPKKPAKKSAPKLKKSHQNIFFRLYRCLRFLLFINP